MSAINTHEYQEFSGNGNYPGRRVTRPEAIPMPFSNSELNTSDVPATLVLGYLLALVSATVLLLTGQPPWFLLTVAVALGVAFFLPEGMNISKSK